MTRRLDPLAFHGFVLRSREPKAVARRLQRALGWPILRKSEREIVLGAGPELFLAIRPSGRSGGDDVIEIHLAARGVSGGRRRAPEDALGGDSWELAAAPGLKLVVREFCRAPKGKWRRKRPPV